MDAIDEKDLDADTSDDYNPEIENLGSPHPLEDKFADALDFSERFQLSDFVVSNMINLAGKAFGVQGRVISEGIFNLVPSSNCSSGSVMAYRGKTLFSVNH